MRHCFLVACLKMAVEASKTTEGLFSCGNTFHILLVNKRQLGISRLSSRGSIFSLKSSIDQDQDPE
jgi:hypothetical protein